MVCSLNQAGVIGGEGAVPADADGLARLVIDRDTDRRAVVEMMSVRSGCERGVRRGSVPRPRTDAVWLAVAVTALPLDDVGRNPAAA